MEGGSRAEILSLCRRDIEIAHRAACPSCFRRIDFQQEMDTAGILRCSCGSIAGSIPKNLADVAVDMVMAKYGINGIYTVLLNWEKLYQRDPDTHYNWLLFGSKTSLLVPAVSLHSHHPSCKVNTSKVIPVLGEWEEDDNIEETYKQFVGGHEIKDPHFLFRFPTCSHCRFAAILSDDHDTILGVDTAWYHDELPICAYPLSDSEFTERLGIELSMEPEKVRGYRENEEAIIKNSCIRELLECLPVIYGQDRSLEARVGSPFESFHGPICPYFELDNEHIDLEQNGGPSRVIAEIPIEFGLENTQVSCRRCSP